MAQNIIIDIQVQDGKAQAKIRGLEGAFKDLKDVIKDAREQLSEQNKVLTGSVQYYDKQIKELKKFRDQTAKTGLEYRKQTAEINKLIAAQKAISGPVRGSVADLQAQRNALIQQQKTLATTSDEYNKYQKRIIEVQSKIDILSSATTKNVKVNQDLISNSGLAGATLTEVGRTISDLPYGIRGVTNNLSQLSTLFVTLISKTDGARNAFALLGKQLNGPLGIILAFQAVIAAIDFFFGSTKKAEEATEDFTDAIASQTQKLKELAYTEEQIELFRNRRGIVNERRIKETGENLRKTVQILSSEFSEFNKMFQSMTDLSDESVNNLINDFQKLLKNREFQATLEERIAKNRAKQSELEGEDLKRLLRDRQRLQDALKKIVLESIDIQRKYQKESFEAFAMDIKDIGEIYATAFADVFKKIDQSLDEYGFFKEGKGPLSIFENFYDDGVQALLEYNTFIEKYSEKSQRELLKIAEDAALKKLKKLADESEGLIDYEKEKTIITEYFSKKRQDILIKEREALLNAAKMLLSNFSSALKANLDAEISVEQRKTNLINNELKKRLLNEKLSADEKKAINNQIQKNEADLQAKRDKLAERQFKLQKAISIGQALINTYEMATRAYNAVLAGPEKFLGIGSLVLAKVAAGIATAFGLAQVNAIAKQKFVPGALKGATTVTGLGGAAGGSPGSQDPTFNIVGTGQQFQLSQAIAQRTGEPVRAYVVTGDVRSGLALERNIIKGSKLG